MAVAPASIEQAIRRRRPDGAAAAARRKPAPAPLRRQRQGRDRPGRSSASSCCSPSSARGSRRTTRRPSATDCCSAPSGPHWFGTTHLGQDIFSQLLVGTRGVDAASASSPASSPPIAVGADRRHRRLPRRRRPTRPVGAVQRLPGHPGAAADHHRHLDDHQRRRPASIALVIGCHRRWAWGARVLRAQTLSLRTARLRRGGPGHRRETWRIIIFEILPNLTADHRRPASSAPSSSPSLPEITLAFIGIVDDLRLELGHDPVLGAEPAGAGAGRLVVVRPGRVWPSRCSAPRWR